jgi:molybdenum cofactor biosynthesis enzyme MoaA
MAFLVSPDLIVKAAFAGEIHSFKVTGDEPLVQVDVHVSPRFIQENLPV